MNKERKERTDIQRDEQTLRRMNKLSEVEKKEKQTI
jgi:hypothetical protein